MAGIPLAVPGNEWHGSSQQLLDDSDATDSTQSEEVAQDFSSHDSILKTMRGLFTTSRFVFSSFSDVFKPFDNGKARFCLAAFFLKKIAFASEGFMFQYASEKFGWRLRDTTWLRVTSAVGAVFATLVAGPLANRWARSCGVSSGRANLGIIRASLMVLVWSFAGAWASTSGLYFLVGEFL